VAATGGIYSGDKSAFDFQLPWLKAVLGFLGMPRDQHIRRRRSQFHRTICNTWLATDRGRPGTHSSRIERPLC
jgi:hypothetical protein